jgi:two-component system NtrC family sensor kinase
MKSLNLTSRFLIPVGAALALVTAALVWDVTMAQTRAAEQAFQAYLTSAELHRHLAHMRLAVSLIGLAVLGAMALVITYMLHRNILRPLAALSEAITRMARGDLAVRAPVLTDDEIGELAHTFNQMGEQLQEANQAYMEMLAFVSHELRNPIASIITDARVLAGGYLGPVEPRQAQKLVRLIGNGSYLLALIREYLDLARMEGGSLAFRPRPSAFPEEVVEPALELILPQLEARGMTLERSAPEGPEVQCDPDLLKIVLVNLLGNAVKYGWEGGILRLGVERRADRLRVTVWNQGPGFSAQERPRLFRKFSRLQSPELQERKGTGVGLYTAWRLVRLHGGSMDARSEPGQWAEFSLEIPQPLPEGL